MQIKLENIQEMIYLIRGHKVMLDSDLAELYGVETKVLNQSVRRNLRRFPEDFMFQLTAEEHEILRSQFVTSSSDHGGRRYQPLVFTENGVAMLSSILKSEIAIDVNIAIMRVFTRLRSFYALEERVELKISTLDANVTQVFKVVFERLENLEGVPISQKKRKKIGLNNNN